jgi:hypothetical protein
MTFAIACLAAAAVVAGLGLTPAIARRRAPMTVIVAVAAGAILFPMACVACSDCVAQGQTINTCDTLIGLKVSEIAGVAPDRVGAIAVALVIAEFLALAHTTVRKLCRRDARAAAPAERPANRND